MRRWLLAGIVVLILMAAAYLWLRPAGIAVPVVDRVAMALNPPSEVWRPEAILDWPPKFHRSLPQRHDRGAGTLNEEQQRNIF